MFSKIIGTSSQFVMEGVKNLVVGNKVFILLPSPDDYLSSLFFISDESIFCASC